MPSPDSWMSQYDGVPLTDSGYSFASPPPAGWRPFANDSPFNTPIAASPAIDPNSAAVVAWLCTTLAGPMDQYIRPGTNDDYGYPIYWADDVEEIVRGKCLAGATAAAYLPGLGVIGRGTSVAEGVTSVHNRLFPRPEFMAAAGGEDANAVIIGGNYALDFWLFDIWAPGAGMAGFKYAGIASMDGNGVDESGSASASGISLAGGNIRLVDLQAGLIPHALKINVRWVGTQVRAPAIGRATWDNTIVSVGDAVDIARPPTGARFRLNYTTGEIAALSVPTWKKTILTAMKDYGMYVTDTIGGQSWNIVLEAGTPYVARGLTDPWETFAIAEGWAAASPDGYVFPLKAGVDWAGKLQMLAAGE